MTKERKFCERWLCYAPVASCECLTCTGERYRGRRTSDRYVGRQCPHGGYCDQIRCKIGCYITLNGVQPPPSDQRGDGYWLGTAGTTLTREEFDDKFQGNTMEAVMVGGWKWVSTEPPPSDQKHWTYADEPGAAALPSNPVDYETEYLKLAPCYTIDGLREFVAKCWPDWQLVRAPPTSKTKLADIIEGIAERSAGVLSEQERGHLMDAAAALRTAHVAVPASNPKLAALDAATEQCVTRLLPMCVFEESERDILTFLIKSAFTMGATWERASGVAPRSALAVTPP